MNRKLTPGDTIYCWGLGENFIGHKNMLYLGDDKVGKERVLVQSKKWGWDIISLRDLPKDKVRSSGRFNLKEEVYSKSGKASKFVFIYFDRKKYDEELEVTVQLINGEWKLKNDFKEPSWKC